MSRCPKLDTDNTGWFSYDNICKVNGMKVGDENDRTKVETLCDCDYDDNYKRCPIYQRS